MSHLLSQLWLAQASEAGAVGATADSIVSWLLGNGGALFSLINTVILVLTAIVEQLFTHPFTNNGF